MITVDDLKDWMDENGEDVVMDGPYDIQDWDGFGGIVIREFKKVYNIETPVNLEEWCEELWDIVGNEGLDYDDVMDLLLKVMAEYINENNITELKY